MPPTDADLLTPPRPSPRPAGTAAPTARRRGDRPFAAPVIVLAATLGWLVASLLGEPGARAALLVPTAGVALGVGWLLWVGLRDGRRLVHQIRSRDFELLSVLDGLPVAVMLRDETGTLVHLNRAGEQFLDRLGVGVDEVRSGGAALLDHVAVVTEEGQPATVAQLPVVSASREGSAHDSTLGYELPDGGRVWYAVRAAPITMSTGARGTVVTLDDVTERQQARSELASAALRDPLTGVLNRRGLEQRLHEAGRHRPGPDGAFGLVYVDLDGFKAINDRLGHQLGDDVLVATAARLVGAVRPTDAVCRMGGDEFLVLCSPMDRKGLAELVARLRSLPPLPVPGTAGMVVTCSVGAALVGPDDDLEDALRRADLDMYRSKRRGARPRTPMSPGTLPGLTT